MTKESTTTAAVIELAGEKQRLDAACRQLLAEKMILANIMKLVIEEYKDCTVKEIADKYIVGIPEVSTADVDGLPSKIESVGTVDSSITEGTITYDVKFHAKLPKGKNENGIIVNIEVQNNFFPGYPLSKRAVYYSSRMISSQKGTVFHNSDYQKIRKVYSIWICPDTPSKRKNTINQYRITEKCLVGNSCDNETNYDLINYKMICLGDAAQAEPKSILHLLDILFSDKISAVEKKRICSEMYEIPMSQELEGRLDVMCDYSEGVYRRGVAAGRKQGRADGKAEGKAEGKALLATVIKALKTGTTVGELLKAGYDNETIELAMSCIQL